jgi:hypothetical protein
MRTSLVLVAVCATSVALAGPSLAGGTLAKAAPLTAADPAGDANFSNDQGGLLPSAPPSAGSSVRAGADIRSVTLGRTDDGKKVKAFTVTMTLDAAPESSTQYRVAMEAPGCSVWYVEYQFPPAGSEVAITKGGVVRENCTGENVFTDVDAQINGNSIVWTIPVKGMPGDVKLGTPLHVKYGQTNLETAVVVPAFDMVAIDKTFKIGQ